MNVEWAMDAKGRSGREAGNDAVRGAGAGRCDWDERATLDAELLEESEDRLSDEDEADAESGEGEWGAKRELIGLDADCSLGGATAAACKSPSQRATR